MRRAGIPWSPRSVAVLVLLAVLAAGCLEEPAAAGEDRPHRISGSFTESTTSENTEELAQSIAPHGGTLFVMESFPMQYAIETPTRDSCQEVTSILRDRHYVATVGECRPIEEARGGDEPVTDAPPYGPP